jgi:hypothetical protein
MISKNSGRQTQNLNYNIRFLELMLILSLDGGENEKHIFHSTL